MDSQARESLAKHISDLYIASGRAAVAEYLQCPYGSAAGYFRELGVSLKDLYNIRTTNIRMTPKYKNLFIEDTPLKYYLIGFILGDGSIGYSDGEPNVLNLSSSDYDLILQLSHFFPGCRIQGPNRGNYVINLYDRPICKTLQSLGFVSAKSKVGMTLPHIPDKFVYEFLCGLLDSDGCVRIDKRTGAISVFWAGHPSYMQEIYSILESLGFYPHLIVRDGITPLMLVTVSGSQLVTELLSRMNAVAPVTFDRKRGKVSTCTHFKTPRALSMQINEELRKNPPKNRIELLNIASRFNMTESCIRHRLSRMGILYSPDYSNCGHYERKYKQEG